MKNPLNKRLPREFFGEFGKYLVIFLFMTISIGFISGFLVAGGSMIQAYDESFEKYNIEDGNFVLKEKAQNTLLNRLEKEKVTVFPDFYREEETDHDLDGETDSTIRIFENRDTVNKVCLMSGEFPEQKNEIVIDRMYADNNGLEAGDKILVGGKELTVSGLVALSDYSALFSDNNDIMFDAVKFSVAVMTKEGVEQFPEEHLRYKYSWIYEKKPQDEIEEKKMSEDFLEVLSEETVSADITIDCFLPQYSNQAIHFTGDDMGGDKTMMIVLLYILIVILAFVFSVTIKHTIVKESAVIGTLRASGYTKGEIFRHYLTMPMVVTLFAAVIGNVLGYTVFKNMVASMYYGSYSLPTYVTIWNGEAFVLTTVVPLLIMLATNAFALVRKLQCSPLQFIRRDLSRKRGRRALRIPDFSFFNRFRIRIILQNSSSYLTLFVGILFSGILLMFGMMMTPLFAHYKDDVVNNMLANYQYVLKTQVKTENEGAEKYCLTSLTYQGEERSEDISIYGMAENSRYLKEEMPSEGVCISDGFSEKYEIDLGDKIQLKEKYGNKKYEFEVSKIIKYSSGLAIFMSDEAFIETFDMEADYFSLALTYPELFFDRLASPEEVTYFTGYLSDEEITDIDDKYIESCITEEDLTKLSRQMDVSMGSMFYMINVFAVVLAALLIYLLTKLILEKNTNSISMVKILGYEDREIARLYLLSTTWVVLVSVLISFAVSTWFMISIYRVFMMQFSGWLNCYIAPEIYPEMFIMLLFAYGVVALLQFRRIKRIPMDEALKNVE